MGNWFKSGAPWVWLTASAVSLSLVMVLGLLGLISAKGLVYFWPKSVADIQYRVSESQVDHVIGEVYDTEKVPVTRLRESGVQVEGAGLAERVLVKRGNRDITGLDFQWLVSNNVINREYPSDLMVLERREWGNFYGYLQGLMEQGQPVTGVQDLWRELHQRLDRVEEIYEQIREIEKGEIGAVNYALERLRLKQRRLELDDDWNDEYAREFEQERAEQNEIYNGLQQRLTALYNDINRDALVATVAGGQQVTIALSKVVRAFRPNALSVFGKTGHYLAKLWEFVSDEPREANTEGGIFPAIFGTVMMVFIMTIIVTPFGVVAAVYLREYAKQGPLTRLIRIAVNNLAGVPSIVYGVFGLGFFVYFLGGTIDQLFFPEALPAPTFGTPAILWASLTLAILTLPVVIVATEEGLARIPSAVREGSLALGATKAETLWRIVLPMASPAMITGLILAIARAAGEVAPLMLVGVVKLAPSLPLDGNFPFLHLDRKFMHLGFHIYDVGFQSPNIEAARPLVYATALLLVIVIILLNLLAIAIRNRLRERYRSYE